MIAKLKALARTPSEAGTCFKPRKTNEKQTQNGSIQLIWCELSLLKHRHPKLISKDVIYTLVMWFSLCADVRQAACLLSLVLQVVESPEIPN